MDDGLAVDLLGADSRCRLEQDNERNGQVTMVNCILPRIGRNWVERPARSQDCTYRDTVVHLGWVRRLCHWNGVLFAKDHALPVRYLAHMGKHRRGGDVCGHMDSLIDAMVEPTGVEVPVLLLLGTPQANVSHRRAECADANHA